MGPKDIAISVLEHLTRIIIRNGKNSDAFLYISLPPQRENNFQWSACLNELIPLLFDNIESENSEMERCYQLSLNLVLLVLHEVFEKSTKKTSCPTSMSSLVILSIQLIVKFSAGDVSLV